mgnify:FL=1|jgi:AcrR family transcriptional regulator
MSKGAVDRRIARTRAGLQHALIALILEKSYEAITVDEICARANVGRSTFYLHYASKDALKRSGFDHLRQELAARQQQVLADSGVTERLGFGLALFEHAREHIDLYRALVGGKGGTIAITEIRELLAVFIRKEIRAVSNGRTALAVPSDLVVEYLVGAYVSVLTWWLDRGAEPPPRALDEMFRRMAENGALSHLHEAH